MCPRLRVFLGKRDALRTSPRICKYVNMWDTCTNADEGSVLCVSSDTSMKLISEIYPQVTFLIKITPWCNFWITWLFNHSSCIYRIICNNRYTISYRHIFAFFSPFLRLKNFYDRNKKGTILYKKKIERKKWKKRKRLRPIICARTQPWREQTAFRPKQITAGSISGALCNLRYGNRTTDSLVFAVLPSPPPLSLFDGASPCGFRLEIANVCLRSVFALSRNRIIALKSITDHMLDFYPLQNIDTSAHSSNQNILPSCRLSMRITQEAARREFIEISRYTLAL